MRLTNQQVGSVETAIWLFGLAALFFTNAWWPGIMFVLGTSTLVGGLVRGHGWAAFQASLWTFGIGVLALFHFSIVAFLILVGLSVLLGAFIRPPMLAKPKPDYDHSLD